VRLLLADNPSSKSFTKNYQERYKKKGIRSIKKYFLKGLSGRTSKYNPCVAQFLFMEKTANGPPRNQLI
jgi:hypothetical protein